MLPSQYNNSLPIVSLLIDSLSNHQALNASLRDRFTHLGPRNHIFVFRTLIHQELIQFLE